MLWVSAIFFTRIMMQTEPLVQRYLSRKQAALYLGVISPATLAKLAVVGGGPRYYKLSRRVGYRIEDLDAWAKARMSTSDTGEAATVRQAA